MVELNFSQLGKSMVQEMINTYKDYYFRYVNTIVIKNEVFNELGKKLYANEKAFLDFMKSQYDDNFLLKDAESDAFDFVHSLVEEYICSEEGNHKWSDSIGYYPKRNILLSLLDLLYEEGYNKKFNIVYNTNYSGNSYRYFTIFLDEKKDEKLYVLINSNGFITFEHRNKSFDSEKIFSLDLEYVRGSYEYAKCVLIKFLTIYKHLNEMRKLTDFKFGRLIWSFISDEYEYDFVSDKLGCIEVKYEDFSDDVDFLTSLGRSINNFFKTIEKLNSCSRGTVCNTFKFDIKANLNLYNYGVIDNLSDESYVILKSHLNELLANHKLVNRN